MLRVLVVSSFQEFWFRSRTEVCSEDRRINYTCNGNFTKTGNKRYKYNNNNNISKEICRTSEKKSRKDSLPYYSVNTG
jgi:hypothetical protein